MLPVHRIKQVVLSFVSAILLSISGAYAQIGKEVFVPRGLESLSNSFVRCFFKDSEGYMWLGTNDGLIKYDGTNVVRYEQDPDDAHSLPHNNINVITEDANHQIWVGTSLGLSTYDKDLDRFDLFDPIPSQSSLLSNSYVTSVTFDPYGRIWIGTHGGGVNIFDPENKEFTYLDDSGKNMRSKASNYINSLLVSGDLVWCGSKGGLKAINAKTLTWANISLLDGTLPEGQVTQLIKDSEGDIWLSTLSGEIFKITTKGNQHSLKREFSGKTSFGAVWTNILSLSSDKNGNIWIGGENSGLNFFDSKSKEMTRIDTKVDRPNKLPTTAIRSVYIDDQGLVWIGTFNKGALVMSQNTKKFETFGLGNYQEDDLTGNEVNGFSQDQQGNIWVAFNGQGLKKIDAKTKQMIEPADLNRKLPNKFLTAIITANDNSLWVGTYGDGIYRIDPKTREITHKYPLKSDGFGENKVSNIYQDSDGKIWAGTHGSGVFHLDEKTQRFVSLYERDKPNSITNTSYISSILEDSSGGLWIATMHGLFLLEEVKENSFQYTQHLQGPGSLSSSAILTLHEDSNQNLWIGTSDRGLNKLNLNSGEFSVFLKRDGLASNNIRGVLSDSKGNLWISGNQGLSKICLHKGEITNYTVNDGLKSNYFLGRSCLKAQNGEMFFGSNNGFNAFFPDEIKINSERPLVVLSGFRINNEGVTIGAPDSPLSKHIRLTKEVELNYQQRSFVINFVAVNYNPAVQHNYSYKLEGFDDNWNHIGPNHSATYTNLDPGNYTFLVKAANNDGVWSETPTSLNITIRQTPWKSWWAITIYLTISILAAFFVNKILLERANMKNKLDLEQIARRKEHELSESKTQFFTNISHELRTPLSLISMPLESLISMKELSIAARERIGTIHANADKMMRLVNELMDFNKLESARLKLNVQRGEVVNFITEIAAVFHDLAVKRNIHFGIYSPFQKLEGWFDHDKLEKVLANMLSNAFKFTADGGEIKIQINLENPVQTEGNSTGRILSLTIVDNGIGISSEELPLVFDKFYQAKSSLKIASQGTGIGLALTKGLVELHRGSIRVVSTPNLQTEFIIHLPIDRSAYSETEIAEVSSNLVSLEGSLASEIDFIKKNNLLVNQHDKPKVLLVEDNEELRSYISMELKWLFNILEAKNGEEGLEMAVKNNPDLIISDILMPLKSGVELCGELKANLNTCHIPIILLSSKTALEDQIDGISCGADIYITKPFSVRFLTTQANQIIESRKMLFSRFSHDVYLMPSKMATNDMDQAFLQKAIDYIIANMLDPQLGVDSIADLFNLSRMQVYRKIKGLTGNSVVDFIRTVRIKEALKLMETEKFTLSEIAYQTGFNSASYFTTCFKNQFGKAPSEYLENKSHN